MKHLVLAILVSMIGLSHVAFAEGDGMGSWSGSGGHWGENPGGPWGPGGPNWSGPKNGGGFPWSGYGSRDRGNDGYYHRHTGFAQVTCFAQDKRGNRFGLRSATLGQARLQQRALNQCRSNSPAPRSCFATGCY